MLLCACLSMLLALSQVSASGVITNNEKYLEGHQKHDVHPKAPVIPSKAELKWGREIVKSIHAAVERAKKLPSTALYGDDSVCYEQVGCFTRHGGDAHPLYYPDLPSYVGTKFFLYSSKNNSDEVVLDYLDNSTLRVNHFNKIKDLVFIVHGFGGSSKKHTIVNMTQTLLQLKDLNVIVVDWRNGSAKPLYLTAAGNTALVGREMSLLLQRLMNQYPKTVRPSRVHLIGYSLGAHVAGFCGRHFAKETGRKIGRITALDAAGPLFESYEIHLSRNDAKFVDAIHTSAGTNLLKGHLGMEKPFGHANFYPNGGRSQPGCWFFDVMCHHRRSVEYFVESAQSRRYCRFRAGNCLGGFKSFMEKNCTRGNQPEGEMGYYSIHAPGRGAQFLWTNDNCPFCRA